ncbi:MAG TPA: formate dehydrogenase accessory sulfurtransferase FdhD [Acidimicrobiia bacterium]|nr:formate dehydrogenase accessory sulfurtransferase FdhD [Acidimicrobiia bacterium]
MQRDGGKARGGATAPTSVRAVEGEQARERSDRLVTEEPMEIRVQGPGQEPEPLVVTMRTPGQDFDLAVGFCITEGVVDTAADLATIAYCLPEDGVQRYNVVTIRMRRPVDLAAHERGFAANASCGLCGKTTLEQIAVDCGPVGPGPRVGRSALVALPERLRRAQAVFDATGGLHAAACFGPDGDLTVLREDIGRHNAVDKVVGHAALEQRLPLADQLLLVSGRMSFEIVQKAAVAGIPVLCAVSAPSSLAVEAADRLGQTVVGFLRGDRFNVYTHPERIDLGVVT